MLVFNYSISNLLSKTNTYTLYTYLCMPFYWISGTKKTEFAFTTQRRHKNLAPMHWTFYCSMSISPSHFNTYKLIGLTGVIIEKNLTIYSSWKECKSQYFFLWPLFGTFNDFDQSSTQFDQIFYNHIFLHTFFLWHWNIRFIAIECVRCTYAMHSLKNFSIFFLCQPEFSITNIRASIMHIVASNNIWKRKTESERFTYPDMVQRNMDNIFHVFRLAHLKCPIRHLDRILSNRCRAQPYCCRLSSDLCALNQSNGPEQSNEQWQWQWRAWK